MRLSLIHVGSNPNRSAVDIAWEAVLTTNKAAKNLKSLITISSSDNYVSEAKMGLLHKCVLGLARLELKHLIVSIPDHVIDERDAKGQTPLYWAARRGDVQAVSLLLSAGADKNSMTHCGANILTAAIMSTDRECIWKILQSDCDINYRQKDGYASLHHCCRYNVDTNIIKVLLDRGADKNAQTALGHTPLMIACFNRRTAAAKFLIDNQADVDPQGKNGGCALHFAVMSGDHHVAHHLLSRGAKHTLKTKNGETFLHFLAQRNGDCEMIRSLELFDLCNVDVEGVTRKDKLTALQIAEMHHECDADWLEMFRGLVMKIRDENIGEKSASVEYFDASEHFL